MAKIRRIPGVEDVKTTAFMPSEREHNELFTLLKTLPDGVIAIDTKANVTVINEAALDALTLQRDEVAESLRALRRAARNEPAPLKRPGQHNWVHRLPFKMRFKKSKIYLSVIPILALGFGIGILTSVMGVGGGFIMVPAMIYLLGMPTSVVVGTSLFQIIFVTSNVTFLQAYQNQTVDMVLAVILLIGGVVGAQLGEQGRLRRRGRDGGGRQQQLEHQGVGRKVSVGRHRVTQLLRQFQSLVSLAQAQRRHRRRVAFTRPGVGPLAHLQPAAHAIGSVFSQYPCA